MSVPVSAGEFQWKLVTSEVISYNWLEEFCYSFSKKMVPTNVILGFDAIVHYFAQPTKAFLVVL